MKYIFEWDYEYYIEFDGIVGSTRINDCKIKLIKKG